MRLKDRLALVTGAGQGIGRQISLTFAQEGAAVAVADMNEQTASQVADEIKGYGGQALALPMDVTDREGVRQALDRVASDWGKLDILVNNAGIIRDQFFLKMTPEQWDQVLAVNLTGLFNCSQAAVPLMVEQEYGRVISISSVVGQTGNMGQVNYAASKAGVMGFTKALAREMVRYNITVNAIAPGFIWTPMKKTVPEKIVKKIIAAVPMGDLGQPQDVANVALFLAAEESSYITGQVIPVNGGYYM